VSELVECDEHGAAASTIVCMHVADGLRDGRPRGFLWSIDDEGEHQAVCSDCDALSQDEWSRVAVDFGRVLCFECYLRAARMNGVEVAGVGQ
jgi:hypothetical protein